MPTVRNMEQTKLIVAKTKLASAWRADGYGLGISREVDDERFTLVGHHAPIGEGTEHGRLTFQGPASRPSGSRLTSSGLPSAQTFASAISATRSASPNSGESPNESRTAAACLASRA